MRIVAGILIALLLASCGTDGAPERPEPKKKSGITVSGEARIGVVYSE